MDPYERAKSLIQAHVELADFAGPQTESLIERAEQTLGVRFPPIYRRFLSEYGAGGFGATELFGIFREDFESSGVPDAVWRALKLRRDSDLPHALVPVEDLGDGDLACLDVTPGSTEGAVIRFMPGVSPDDQDPERLASDFGAYLQERIEAELESSR
jgi:hypothetical protein